MVFALFSVLPRPLSLALWLLGPVAAALFVTRGRPLTLLFAPLFAHFVGGQSAVFAMAGLWGYRRSPAPGQVAGGVWLAVMLLKPQLGLVPLVWAAGQWARHAVRHRRVPPQMWAFVAALAALYLPSFCLMPDWPLRWLGAPRPVFERALAGWLPRTLLFVAQPGQMAYWVALAVGPAALLALVWRAAGGRLTFDLVMLWSFVVSPLVHDYDLIQLLPLLAEGGLPLAVVLSLPTWWVIVTAYANDAAWYAVTLIAPGLLAAALLAHRRSTHPAP
jgi:hypothetical protein